MGKRKYNSFNTSVWCTRFVHISITIGISTMLLTKNSVMRQQLNAGQLLLPILYVLATVLSIGLYFVVACMDPGYVRKGDPDVKEIKIVVDDEESDDISLYETRGDKISDKIKNEDDSNVDENTKMLDDQKNPTKCFNLEPHQRCGLCGLQRPIRARHCRDCNRCVRKFDHHCPWITNCVGEKNHRWFWTFLLYEIFLIIWSIYISTTAYSSTTSDWIAKNIILIIADIILGILLLVVVSLFAIHTYMLVNNHTTWETISRHRISYLKEIDGSRNPFDLGVCHNISTFFCYFKPFDWTVVYNKSKNSLHVCQDPERSGQTNGNFLSEIHNINET